MTKSLLELIGNTPLLCAERYTKDVDGCNANIFAKLEYLNPTGSAKDRAALYMILDAEEKLSSYDDSDIVELELIQNEPLAASDVKSLRKTYPCVSNISLVRNFDVDETKRSQSRKLLSDEELFKEFYKSARGVEPADDLTELFILCKGEEHEAD